MIHYYEHAFWDGVFFFLSWDGTCYLNKAHLGCQICIVKGYLLLRTIGLSSSTSVTVTTMRL